MDGELGAQRSACGKAEFATEMDFSDFGEICYRTR